MNQNSFSHTIRITVFATGLLISSFTFCPSHTPPPLHRVTSCEDLEKNYVGDTKQKMFELARAINLADFETFKELYATVDPNFAVPRKGKESLVPIFKVLEKNDRSPLYLNHGHICRRLLMLQLLLEKGADSDVINQKGQRPIDLANDEERALLKKYGT